MTTTIDLLLVWVFSGALILVLDVLTPLFNEKVSLSSFGVLTRVEGKAYAYVWLIGVLTGSVLFLALMAFKTNSKPQGKLPWKLESWLLSYEPEPEDLVEARRQETVERYDNMRQEHMRQEHRDRRREEVRNRLRVQAGRARTRERSSRDQARYIESMLEEEHTRYQAQLEASLEEERAPQPPKPEEPKPMPRTLLAQLMDDDDDDLELPVWKG